MEDPANARTARWWATFNAALAIHLGEGETITSHTTFAAHIASEAHGFVSNTYKGPKPERP